MEGEPIRWWGTLGKRLDAQALGIVPSVFRHRSSTVAFHTGICHGSTMNKSLIALVFAVFVVIGSGLTALNVPSGHKTCTVTGIGFSVGVASGQSPTVVETTCGSFRPVYWSQAWRDKGELKVGETYSFGLYVAPEFITGKSIISFEKV